MAEQNGTEAAGAWATGPSRQGQSKYSVRSVRSSERQSKSLSSCCSAMLGSIGRMGCIGWIGAIGWRGCRGRMGWIGWIGCDSLRGRRGQLHFRRPSSWMAAAATSVFASRSSFFSRAQKSGRGVGVGTKAESSQGASATTGQIAKTEATMAMTRTRNVKRDCTGHLPTMIVP